MRVSFLAQLTLRADSAILWNLVLHENIHVCIFLVSDLPSQLRKMLYILKMSGFQRARPLRRPPCYLTTYDLHTCRYWNITDFSKRKIWTDILIPTIYGAITTEFLWHSSHSEQIPLFFEVWSCIRTYMAAYLFLVSDLPSQLRKMLYILKMTGLWI